MIVALAGVPPIRGKVHAGDGLGLGDGVRAGVGDAEGEVLGAGLAEVVGVGVAGGLLPLGPAVPQATTRTESAIQDATRMREGFHQDSSGHRVIRQAFDVTFDPNGSGAGSSAFDLLAELVLKMG